MQVSMFLTFFFSDGNFFSRLASDFRFSMRL